MTRCICSSHAAVVTRMLLANMFDDLAGHSSDVKVHVPSRLAVLALEPGGQ